MLSSSTTATYEGTDADLTPIRFRKVTALVFMNVYRSDHCPTETALHLGIFEARPGKQGSTEDPLNGVPAAVQEVLRDTKAWILEGTADFRSDHTLDFQPFTIRAHGHPLLQGAAHDFRNLSSLHLPRSSVDGINLDVSGDLVADNTADRRGHSNASQYGCLDGMQWTRTNEYGWPHRETMDEPPMPAALSDAQPLDSDWLSALRFTAPICDRFALGSAPAYTLR